MKKLGVLLVLALAVGAPGVIVGPFESTALAQTKAKKKKKAKPKKKAQPAPAKAGPPVEEKRERSVVKAVDPSEEEKAAQEEQKEKEAEEKIVPEAPPPMSPEQMEEQRVEDAKRKLEAERRQKSKVTPGAPSRWSNRGAMVPVASTVPVTAELPERAIPIDQVIETPGQSLLGGGREEILSARLSFGFYHLQTKGQDQVFNQSGSVGQRNDTATLVAGEDRDIDFLRARATMGYEHIAGSDFAVRLDVEYRPNISGSRFTDYRLNEAYVSYGLTEFRTPDSPWWGLSLGRLAIREAGYAQADGLAARFRIVDWLNLGVFGGVTANPYGYNWNLRSTEAFSADWYTGGAFVSLQIPELIVNLAGVVTYGNLAVNAADFERAYVYLDGAWLILPELNFVVNGWVDLLPGTQIAQNISGSFNWSPWDELSLALGGGRFTTLLYSVSADLQRCQGVAPAEAIGCSFVAPGTNTYAVNPTLTGVISSTENEPIVPYDAVLMTSIYNSAWVRGAYRVLRDVEVSARFDMLIRDASAHQDQLAATVQNTLEPSPLRLVPGVGVRYRNPQIVDANVEFSYIIDDESQSDAVVYGSLGRGLFGLYLAVDARYYVGRIDGFDTGAFLGYTFPRDWFPGALSIRGAFRFYREDVDVVVPIPGDQFDRVGVTREVTGWNLIQNQDSILGFAGIEWRL